MYPKKEIVGFVWGQLNVATVATFIGEGQLGFWPPATNNICSALSLTRYQLVDKSPYQQP